MAKVYTMNEVAQHNKESDLWLVMHGGVYDLTDFCKKHPGGEEVLIQPAGTDCTTCFDDVGHTEEAKLLKETFKIGVIEKDVEFTSDLKPDQSQEAKTPIIDNDNDNDKDDDDDDGEDTEPEKKTNGMLNITVAAGFLIYAILVYYCFI